MPAVGILTGGGDHSIPSHGPPFDFSLRSPVSPHTPTNSDAFSDMQQRNAGD
jgi:hypothetical protein